MNKLLPILLLALMITPVIALTGTYYNISYNVTINITSLVNITDPLNASDGNFETATFIRPISGSGHRHTYFYYNYSIQENNTNITDVSVVTKYIGDIIFYGAKIDVLNWTSGNWTQISSKTGNHVILTHQFSSSQRNDFISNGTLNTRLHLYTLGGTPPLVDIYVYGQYIQTTYFRDLNFTNCSTGNTKLFTFIAKNETTAGNISGADTEIAFTSVSDGDITKNFSFSFSNQGNFSICTNFPELNYTLSYILEYTDTDYSTRYHYFDSYQKNNSTETINLYLLPTTSASAKIFTVNNPVGGHEEGVIIKALKYDVGTNTYDMVAMGKTNSNGQAVINLQENTQYKYELWKNGVLVKTIDVELLTSATPPTFVIPGDTYGDVFVVYANYPVTCTYSNTTDELSCTMTESSDGSVTKIYWSVYVTKNGTSDIFVLRDEDIQYTFPAVFTFDLTGYIEEGSTVWYGIEITIGDYDYLVFSDYLDHPYFHISKGYGDAGLISALLLILVLAFAGSWNPAVMIALVDVGVFVSWQLHLIEIPTEAAAAIIITLAIAAWVAGRSMAWK